MCPDIRVKPLRRFFGYACKEGVDGTGEIVGFYFDADHAESPAIQTLVQVESDKARDGIGKIKIGALADTALDCTDGFPVGAIP
jgi:hypothetical protein